MEYDNEYGHEYDAVLGSNSSIVMAAADELSEGLTDLQGDSDVTEEGSDCSSQHILDALHRTKQLRAINYFRSGERLWELQAC